VVRVYGLSNRNDSPIRQFRQSPRVAERRATGLLRVEIGRRDPPQIVQGDLQHALPESAPLFGRAAEQGAEEGGDGLAGGRAGFVDGGDDAENRFFQGPGGWSWVCSQSNARSKSASVSANRGSR
jgi:hypothetical protein